MLLDSIREKKQVTLFVMCVRDGVCRFAVLIRLFEFADRERKECKGKLVEAIETHGAGLTCRIS